VSSSDLNIEPAVRRSLPQVVAQQLLDLIREGALGPGDRLPSESELKARFGVGRSTIREALNGLVLIGAIEVRHGQGAFVVNGATGIATGRLDEAVRSSVTRELLEAREAMELSIARLAAERATDEDLTELRKLLDDAADLVARTGAAVEEAARFHLLLAEAAQNEIFGEFIEMILGLLRERGEDMSKAPGYGQWELEAHRALLDAVASGDGERAQRAMARHLNDMRVILFEGWETFRARLPSDDR
jgi:GntR family transcriptional repressor for pyruvate dehydrogenase complex